MLAVFHFPSPLVGGWYEATASLFVMNPFLACRQIIRRGEEAGIGRNGWCAMRAAEGVAARLDVEPKLWNQRPFANYRNGP
jgi:hypothetical protein